MFNRVEQLQKDLFNEFILAKIPTVVENLGQEAAILAIVHNDVYEIFALHDMMERNDIGMSGRELVEMDLLQVRLALVG